MNYLKLPTVLCVFVLTACNGGGDGDTANTTATTPPVEIAPIVINGTVPTGEVIWASKLTNSPINGSVALADDGTLYAFVQDSFGLNGFLMALNPDGSTKWSLDTGSAFVESSTTPSIGSDGTIYIGANALIAVNPTGTVKWEFNLLDSASNPAIGSDGTIYVVDDVGFVYAVNPDGTQKWTLEAEVSHALTSGIVVDSLSNLYYATDNDTIIAINSTGALLWESDFNLSDPTTLSIAEDGTLYTYFSSDGSVVAINPTDGSEKWVKLIGGSSVDGTGVSIGADGTIYVANSGVPSIVYALNPVDGSEIWSSEIPNAVSVTPAISDIDTIYFASKDGDLWALESSGTVKWEVTRPLSFTTLGSPAIGNDGAVYFSTGSGHVVAISTDATGSATSGWPTYLRDAKNTGLVTN